MKNQKTVDELYNLLKPESPKSPVDAFNRQYQPLTQADVTAARKTAQNTNLTGAEAFTQDYLNRKNNAGGTSGKKAPWEDAVILERETTGNRTLDMFKAHEANEARKNALADLQTSMVSPAPVQTTAAPAGSTAANAETAGGKDTKNNVFQNILDTINYANARGGQALDAFVNNLNVLGEQAYSALGAAFNTAKNTQPGGQTVMPSLFGNNKPVLTSSTNENGSLKTPEQINETAGASQGTAGQVKNAVRTANTAVLEKAAQENRNARARAEVDEAHSVSDNPVAKAIGDLVATVSGQAPNIAVSAATGVLGGAALRGLTSSVDAYIEARQEGASVSQAKKYASREALNQGIGDVLLTGIAGTGRGILGKFASTSHAQYALAKMYGNLVTSPAAKTAIKYVGNMLGEGVEEMLQNAWTVANKRLSYNDQAKIDPKEMLYEGVLGAATAGILGSVNIPANYRVYRSDVDTVNAFSKAAAGVTSEAEANAVTEHGYEMINICNQIIADPDSDFDTKARFEYIKGGVQTAMNEMGSNSQSIIESNVAFDEAVDEAADAPFDDPIFAVANIVKVVGENADPDEDIVKATIDKLNDEARTAYNQETNLRVTDEFRRQWEVRRRMLTALADILRNRKTEVKQAVAGLLAAPQTAPDAQTAPNALTSGENSAIINAEDADLTVRDVTPTAEIGNPVMQADGESLLPAAKTPAQENGNKYDLTHREHINTRTGEAQHLFTVGNKLSDADYSDLKKAMKEVGGYWSKFAKGFIVPDSGLPKLADALGKIGVGIDESAYVPSIKTTADTDAQTPASGPLPEIEVLGDAEKGAKTEVKDQEKRPQFEVYPGGGDVVPADQQTSVTGSDTNTEISAEGPDVRNNTAREGESVVNPAEDVTLPGTETAKAPKVTVQDVKEQKDEEKPSWTPESTEPLTAENFPYKPGDQFKRQGTAETWTLKDRDNGMIRLDTGHYIDFNTEYGTFEKWLRSGDFTPVGQTSETAKPERGPVAPTPKPEKLPTSYPNVQDSVFYFSPTRTYRKGDQVKLENGNVFTIDDITGNGLLSTIHLSELGQLYPVERAESMESFFRLLRRYPQNEQSEPKAGETAQGTATASTTPVSAKKIVPSKKILNTLKHILGRSKKETTLPDGFFDLDDMSAATDAYRLIATDYDVSSLPQNTRDIESHGQKKAFSDYLKKTEQNNTTVSNALTPPSSDVLNAFIKTYSSRSIPQSNLFPLTNRLFLNPDFLKDVVDVFPDAKFYVGTRSTEPVYFTAEHGKGIIFPIRYTENEVVGSRNTAEKVGWTIPDHDSLMKSAEEQEKPAEKPAEKPKPEKKPSEKPAEKPKTEEQSVADAKPYEKIAQWVADRLDRDLSIDKKDLQIVANEAYGGTMADGTYDVKDLGDALELGVNRHIIRDVSENLGEYTGNARTANATLDDIDEFILRRIPTQTNRTDEQIKLQQFSTPPNIAFLANWVANITPSDTMLEPSAGIGGLASFAKGMGAKTVVNELSDRRLSLLKTLPFDGFYQENAEQIDNILPDSVKPTVVVMNPPFSANGRTKNKTANAIPHIEQALERLEDGGRLVAILGGGRDEGGGMSDSAPAFKSWWNRLRNDYSIRANIGIDGSNYSKYGTSFNVRLVVIDKTGPQAGETFVKDYKTLSDIPADLERIRNDRSHENGTRSAEGERNGAVQGSGRAPESGTGSGNQSAARPGKRDSDSGTANGSRPDSAGQQPVSDLPAAGNAKPDRGADVVAEKPGAAVSSDDGKPESGRRGESGRDEVPSDNHAEQGSGRVGPRGTGDGADRKPDELVRPAAGIPGAPAGIVKDTKRTPKKQSENDDGVYASYQPAKLTVKGAQKHPAKLVESSAMSAVSSPDLSYVPSLDPKKMQDGTWSDAQLENISYAGQAHQEKLPNGQRKGYFIGDGTGVGKGRQLAGIAMDNFNQGRKRAIWVSENIDLMKDAQRDWKDVGGDPKEIFPFSDLRKKGGAPKEGIMFVPYTTLPNESKAAQADNITLIENWFGKDFDGVIIFDEAHNMGNLTPVKGKRGKAPPAGKALAGNKLQNDLPNARVIYASATGATRIENLSYASRLGLWGEGTAFRDVNDFVSKIGSAGISAMELVARDMKALGVYLARSISYDGVVYDSLEHKLTKQQIAMYDRMSDGWQVVLQNFDKAMELTASEDAREVKNARSHIYGNMQLFYNQVLTSFATPSVIEDIQKELDRGHSCVIQLVNTQEGATKKEVQRAHEEGISLDNVDVTPRQLLVGYVEKYFPVTQYETYIDDDGNEQSRPVLDSQGNPVINKKALQMRDDLIADLNEISIPEGPLDLIVNHFGVDQVAEITGRKQRVINVIDEHGNVSKQLDKRDAAKAKVAEAEAFQNGDKRILIFSGAGSTGRSFHADKRAKNQQQRIHYVLQPGWQADKAVQGFGRTHRSNQVNTPVFRLVRTDVEGHKRFVTSIARRLDQLGALTKGQRQTGSGIFGEKDNLESPLSAEALKSFYKKLGNGRYLQFDPKDVLQKMGLYDKFFDEWDNFKNDAMVATEITTFLNRILSLHVEEQNELFKLFEAERDLFYNTAIENGTLDTGLENVRADKIEIEQEDVVYTDPKTGAETKYVKAKLYNKPQVITTVDAAQNERPGFTGIYRMKDGSVRAAYRIADSTDAMTGEVVRKFILVGPNQGKASRYLESTLKSTCEEVPKKEWQSAWDEEVKRVPEYNEGEAHMITGALLPIWDKLPQGGNVKARRLIASDGSQYLGRVIEKSLIDSVLRGLNVNVKKVKYTGADLYKAIMNDGQTVTLNGSYGSVYTIGRRRVAGENRIEITGPNMFDIRSSYPDLITETIQYSRRYFIPTGSKGVKMLGELADRYGVRGIDAEENTENRYSAGLSRGKWGKGNRDKAAQVRSVSDLVDEAVRIFGIPINTGRMGGVRKTVQGVFKEHPETIRTRTYGDLPTIAHEIGHWFDKKYNLHKNNFVGSLTAEFGDDLRMAGYTDAQIPYESVAEYFRVYLSDKEDAAKRFRDFTDALLSTISEADSKRLAEYSDMTNAYFAADLDRRASAQVHYRTDDSSVQAHAQVVAEQMKRNPGDYLGTISRTFVRNVFDDLVDLRGFGDTYDLAYREKQARSVAYGRLTSAFTDKDGNVIGQSLADVLSDGKIDERNARTFDEYLIARRALDQFEAVERGEDVGTLVYADEELQDADKIAERIDRYERENPTFQDAAEGVYAYERNLLDLAVNSGLMSEELRDRLNELYPHYVPLYRVMDDKDQKTRGAKRGYADQNTPIARFKGSGRDIYSPIESIIQNTEKFTAACMRNDVMMEFADFIDQNEGFGWAAEKIPQAKILDYISTDELGKRLAQYARETDRLDRFSEKEKAEFFENLMGYIGDTLSQWKPAAKQGKRVVSVMRNGQRSYYEIHDEGLYKALTNMDAPQFDLVTKFFGAITRANKFFYTTSNPQFVFTNPQRDLVTGYISSATTDNPIRYVADFAKAFVDAVTNSDEYKAYIRSGGGYMGSVTADYNILKRVKRDVVQPNKSVIRKYLDMVAEFVPRLVDAGETASRLAEWKRALNQGDSNMEAMRKAQEVTVNFARGGRVVKQINQFIPFFQAGFAALSHDYDLFVNGGDGGGGRNGNNGYGLNLSSSGKARRRHAWIKWLLTTGMLALLTWLFNYIVSPKLTGETEEKVKQSCDNLSNYNKNAFYNLYLGNDQFLRIKKTQDMSVPATIVERMMEYYVLYQKDSLNGLADYCFDNILPINPFNGETALDGMLSMLGEVSGLGTAVDLARNKDFKGTPIVSTRYQYLPKEEQYKENTSQVWIALGNALHMSPIQLQYAAEDNFGWAARLLDNLTPYNGERSLGIRNKLITDSVYSTDIINNFYDQKDMYDKSSKAYKANPSSKKYSMEDVYGAYKYGKIADLYSDLNNRTRDEGDNDLSREMRAKSNALIQTVNDDGISVLDRAVIDIAESTGTDVTNIAPYIVVPDHLTYKQGDVKVDLPMDYDDMYLYYTQSQIAFENVYGRIMEAGYDDSVTASMLASARKEINKNLRDMWLNQLVARSASGK